MVNGLLSVLNEPRSKSCGTRLKLVEQDGFPILFFRNFDRFLGLQPWALCLYHKDRGWWSSYNPPWLRVVTKIVAINRYLGTYMLAYMYIYFLLVPSISLRKQKLRTGWHFAESRWAKWWIVGFVWLMAVRMIDDCSSCYVGAAFRRFLFRALAVVFAAPIDHDDSAHRESVNCEIVKAHRENEFTNCKLHKKRFNHFLLQIAIRREWFWFFPMFG